MAGEGGRAPLSAPELNEAQVTVLDADLPDDKADSRAEEVAPEAVPTGAPAKRNADLPTRALSAVVMLLIAGTAFGVGGPVLAGFIGLVAFASLVEAVLLIRRATANPALRSASNIAALVYIGVAALMLVQLPRTYLLILIISVIATDIGAYFTGRAIGGPRIAPRISPSKTWAGLFGGVTASAVWMMLATGMIGTAFSTLQNGVPVLTVKSMAVAALAGGVFAVCAQAGDFLESWLKRKAGAKDSSKLIPGHGGVLDRTDGILPVAIIGGLAFAWGSW